MKPPTPLGKVSRGRADWPVNLEPGELPRVLQQPEPGRLGDLLAAFDEILALDDPNAILKRAVEIAQQRIGLDRVGIFLVDRQGKLMIGTWGYDLRGRLIDEHQIVHEISATDRETFRRSEQDGAHFTVFDSAPIAEAATGGSWVACTPIRSARAPIGILFNDAGPSGRAVDYVKQAHAALLCSLLGSVLDPVRGLMVSPAVMTDSYDGLASVAVEMLDEDPGVGGKQIAAKLGISLSRLARVFKAQLGMSLVEYRNRLRMDRFSRLLDQGHMNLRSAARAAGFGSYSQFYRVFRALRRGTPREFRRAKAC